MLAVDVMPACIFHSPSLYQTQAAPLLCVALTTGRHSRALSLPTEAFSGARRALCHLRSRVEEVCREEVDKISRAGTTGDLRSRKTGQ